MSEFDANDYFNRRAAAIDAADRFESPQDKLVAMESAAKRSADALRQMADDGRKQAELDRASLVGQLGLDPKGVAGRTVNTLAAAYSGTSRMVGDTVGLAVADLPAVMDEALISEGELQAINRIKQGQAQPGDQELVNAKAVAAPGKFFPDTAEGRAAAAQQQAGAMSPMERFERATESRQRGRNIDESFDRSGLVHTGARRELSADIGEDFASNWDQVVSGAKKVWDGSSVGGGAGDVVAGVGKLLFNAVEAGVTNPQASIEYIAENTPQLVVGLAGKIGKGVLTASNLGYASENYQKGLAEYQAKNGGALPDAETRQRMALFAASTAVAEHVTDVKLLDLMKPGVKAVGEAAEDVVKQTVARSFANVAKATTLGAAGEAVTEGYQTFAEGEATLKPATAAEIYEGATIGAVAGGGMAGGGRALAEMAGATKEKVEEAQTAATKSEALEAAIASGDVSALVDSTNPAYSPENAVSALMGNALKEGTTPEKVAENLAQAEKVVADLEAKKAVVEDTLSEVTPEVITGYEKRLVDAQAELATADASSRAELEQTVSLLKEAIADGKRDPEAANTLKKRIAKMDASLAEANSVLAVFREEANPQASVDADVEVINAPVDEADTAAVTKRDTAVKKILGMALQSPNSLSPQQAAALASNQSNGLNAQQRDLLRTFSAARIAENELLKMGDVARRVYTGEGRDVGIKQYRERVAAALAKGDKATALRNLRDLSNFEQDHRQKAEKVTEAWDGGAGKGTQVVRTQDGRWKLHTGPKLTASQRKRGGFPEVNAESLVNEINQEAVALTAALAELRAAFAVTYPAAQQPAPSATVSATTKAPNVPNVSEAQPRTAPAGTSDVQKAKAVGGDAKAGGVPATGASRPVESAGVAEEAQPAPSRVSSAVPESTQSSTVDQAARAAQTTQQATSANNQSTKDTTKVAEQTEAEAFPESAEQTTAQDEQSVTVVPGNLEVLAQKSPEGVAYKLKNLIAEFFTQTAAREGDATQRPLVAVKNFLTEGWSSALEYLQITELSEKQADVLDLFEAKALEWAQQIKANLKQRPSAEFNYQDMIQFMLQETADGVDLEENVKTAIAYAAFSWIADNAAKSAVNSDEEINAILGRDENHPVEEDERNTLGHIGTRQNVVVNALGQVVVQALGLKVASNAPRNTLPNLEASLGAHVLKLLADIGAIERDTISGAAFAAMTGKPETDENAKQQFIKVAREELVQEISDASRRTGSILDKLFSVESGLKEPTFAPVPFNQAKTRNTNQDVPAVLAKVMEHENSVPNYIREDMWHLIEQLDDAAVLDMAGSVSVDPATTHGTKLLSAQAKNDGLARELQRFQDFVDTMMGTEEQLAAPIFFEHSVWKQQRVGISTNAVNPQTSKLQRHMIFRKSWETKVDKQDAKGYENFQLRVLEGLNVKTDKQSNAKSLASWEKTTQAPVIQAAVAVLVKSIKGEAISDADQAALVAGVKEGKKNFHSLDALMALAHEANSTDGTFTVALMGEVDGVTNGPMLSHLLMGAATSVEELFGLLNRGGFFELDSEHSNYNLWRSAPGNFDLYETTALHMTQAVQGLVRDGIFSKKGKRIMTGEQAAVVMGAIYAFTGTLADNGKVETAGRNIIKTPLTAMVFGSSTFAAVESMANKFIDSIYSSIEDLAKGEGDLTREQLLENLNTLLINGGGQTLDTDLTVEALMSGDLDPDQVKAIKQTFHLTLGASVKSTMETDFAAFIERRRAFNVTADTIFKVYDAVEKALRDELVSELVASGEIASRKDKDGRDVPLHDLTSQQEGTLRKRLEALAPVMHTAMSKDSNTLNAGLHISKSGRKLSEDVTYKGQANFGTKFPDGTASTKFTGYERRETAPGVAMLPMAIHSSDSAGSHYAADGNEVLNVHDAHGAGLATFEQTARNLNEATWSVMLNYSPAHEMAMALSRTLVGLSRLVQDGTLPESVRTNLHNAIADMAAAEEMDAEQFLEVALTEAKANAFAADSMKLKAMAQMQAVDQYALEGGQYTVTAEDRAEAEARRAELTAGLNAAEKIALQQISDYLGTNDAQGEATTNPELDEKVVPDVLNASKQTQGYLIEEYLNSSEELTPFMRDMFTKVLDKMVLEGKDLQTAVNESGDKIGGAEVLFQLNEAYIYEVESAFGGLGNGGQPQNAKLVAAFEAKPEMTGIEALRLAYSTMGADLAPNMRQFYQRLIAGVSKYMPEDVKVVYLQEGADPYEVPHSTGDSYGWFAPENNTVYIVGTDFRNAGVSPELVVHELLHAVTAAAIERGRTDPNGPEAAFVADMEALLKKAKEHVATLPAPVRERYTYALSSVDELVAYGLSNEEFQTVVLSKVTMQSKTRKNALVSGMKVFIDSLTKLFFGPDAKHQAVGVNGMAILINNVTGLLEASKTQGREAKAEGRARVLGMAVPNPMASVQDFSTLDIHGALPGNHSTAFDNHLRGVLGSIVQKLHGPFGAFKAALMKDQAITPLDVWMKALATGVAPFASAVGHSPLMASEQERHAIEQIEVTVAAAAESSPLVYRELAKLYAEAKEALKGKLPQDQYDFIFEVTQGADGKSDYLARFAAIGLGHEGVNTLLKFQTAAGKGPTKSIADKVQAVFEKILELFHGAISKTYKGQPADEKLLALVGKLVDIEAKNKARIAHRANSNSPFAPVEGAVKDAAEAARKLVGKAAGSGFIRNNRFGAVQGAGALVKTIADDKVEQFLDNIYTLRSRHFDGLEGMAAGFLTGLRGPKEYLQKLLRATKNNERTRKAAITNAASAALQMFANQGKDLSDRTKAAVSQVFLRSGAHVLLDGFTMADIENMLGNASATRTAIGALEAQLSGPFKRYYIAQANALAYYKATGRVKSPNLMMNAHNIVRLAGTARFGRVAEADAVVAEKIVEKLVALYAIDYSEPGTVAAAKDLLRAENNRTDGNGVEFVLKAHKALEAESLDRLFGGQRALMMHGYTPEIYNPHTEVKVATEAEGKELIARGYKLVGPVMADRADPDTEKRFMYQLKDGGLAPYLSGIMSLTDMSAKGSEAHSGYFNLNTTDGTANAALQNDIRTRKQQEINGLFTQGARADLRKPQANYMAPVLNESGDVVNYRYLMADQTKDQILDRTNSFEKIIGVHAGSIYDKQTTREQNRKAVEASRADYQANFAKMPKAYVTVGPKSPIAEMRELWSLLPEATKDDIRAVWGRDGMQVRTDAVDIMFGYRKLSATNAVQAAQNRRQTNANLKARGQQPQWHKDAVAQLFTGVIEMNLTVYARVKLGLSQADAEDYAKRATVTVARAERVWQEVVREAKDIIVVKSGIVMMGNIWSNVTQLSIAGVSMTDIVRHHLVALKGATNYQMDSAELARLKILRDADYMQGNADEIRKQIIRLEDALARNPVRELIDAGLMPTIVEDVASEADPYSYKSAFVRSTEKYTSKLNPKVLSAAKGVYMAHDTRMYQGLTRITQLSDFVARYTLYQHAISRKDTPLSKDEAIQYSSEAFVNYDIPMHRGMQYLDDMGITMFTKYFIGIQRVLLKLGRENPARVLMALTLGNFMDLGPIVLDGSAVGRIGNNPLQWGIFEYPAALDDLGTVSAAMSLIK